MSSSERFVSKSRTSVVFKMHVNVNRQKCIKQYFVLRGNIKIACLGIGEEAPDMSLFLLKNHYVVINTTKLMISDSRS